MRDGSSQLILLDRARSSHRAEEDRSRADTREEGGTSFHGVKKATFRARVVWFRYDDEARGSLLLRTRQGRQDGIFLSFFSF